MGSRLHRFYAEILKRTIIKTTQNLPPQSMSIYVDPGFKEAKLPP